MNKNRWFKSTLVILLGLGAISAPNCIYSVEQEEECSKEVLLSYFPEVFVKETLGKFNVPEDQWDAIVRELGERDKGIIKTVESKAAKMSPNPLSDPQQRQAAVKLFRETIFDNFSAVMKKHGVTDEKKIQGMLADIQQQKAQRFEKCMQQRKHEMPTPPPTGKIPEDDMKPASEAALANATP